MTADINNNKKANSDASKKQEMYFLKQFYYETKNEMLYWFQYNLQNISKEVTQL